MAVVNKLPSVGTAKDAGIAFIGMGWMSTKTNGSQGMADVLYIDKEYFAYGTDSRFTIIAKKDFDALIIIAHGFAGGTGSAQRVMYHPPAGGAGDFLANAWGNYTQANCEHHFSAGEEIGLWQSSNTALFTAGVAIILVNE